VQFVLFVDKHDIVGISRLLIVAEQVEVHPEFVLVTVTVYVPPVKPLKLALVEPLLHK
jgi:hypothetical protein